MIRPCHKRSGSSDLSLTFAKKMRFDLESTENPSLSNDWSDDAEHPDHRIIVCDRFNEGHMDLSSNLFELDGRDNVTVFKSNKPLLLRGFRCSAIVLDDSPSDIFHKGVHVKITENDENYNYFQDLLNIKTTIKLLSPNIIIPSVRIQPYLNYKISIGQFSNRYKFQYNQLKHEVNIEPDIIIKFGDFDHAENHESDGIISALNFQRI